MSARKWTALAVAAAGSLVLAGSSSVEARSPGAGGGRIYDPATVTTLSGTVTGVDVVPGRGGRSGRLHVTVESSERSVNVHLGPSWFLDQEGFKVAKGDAISVTGSLVDSGNAKALIAREVQIGGKTLKLRDNQGTPVWSRGPKRP
jgi:hypothetical protein